MKAAILAIVLVVVVALGLVIARDRPSPDQQAVEYRQALMTVIEGATDPLFQMQSGRLTRDDALIRRHAAELPILSSMVAEAFARDTHASSHLQTAALPYVWTDPAMFAKAVHQLRLDSDALQLAVGGTDQSRIDHAIHSLDTTCTQCHREFRAE